MSPPHDFLKVNVIDRVKGYSSSPKADDNAGDSAWDEFETQFSDMETIIGI